MYKACKIFSFFLQNKKVLKFQHFRDSTKILDFHSRAVEHVFFGILRLPYTKLPLKKSLFRAFIHLNTPWGYLVQGQTRHAGLRKVKRATPDCAKPPAAPSRRCGTPSASFICGRFRARRPTGSIESAVRGGRRCSKGLRRALFRKAVRSSCCPASTDCRHSVRCAAGTDSHRPEAD